MFDFSLRRRRRFTLASATLVSIATAASFAAAPLGAQAAPTKAKGGPPVGTDTRTVGPNLAHGKALGINKQESEQIVGQAPKGPAKIGKVATWLGYDDYEGDLYLKNYTLRSVGSNIEVWVANDLAFPTHEDGTADCRTALGLTTVTDAQISAFVHEFDTNIYPTESADFSVPPPRDGHNAILPKLVPSLPSSEYKGPGSDIVVLVDNVRDANYYDPTSPDGQTYIAGFFYSVFNEYFDRNVMTIDVYDWLHRTGANPPDNSNDTAYKACATELGASAIGRSRPHLYEGTFAHEYQHLLEYYASPGEESWVNEGLSDYAETLVGYVDPSLAPANPQADSHIACFLGYLANEGFGGPENSLTEWGDQGNPETLCDYGAVYTFMQYLYDHFGGAAFLSALHNEDLNGVDGLQAVLDDFSPGTNAMDVIRNWAAAMALDHVLGTAASFTGGNTSTYSSNTLDASINWDATYGDINHDGTFNDPGNEAYSTPGAPPNGSDYVRFVDSGGNHVGASTLSSINFSGTGSLEPDPVLWTVQSVNSNSMLYSGSGPNFDRAIIKSVNLGSPGTHTLAFDTQWNTEPGYDYGFVQVSTDAGATWHSLSNADMTTSAASDAIPTVQDNLPGFNGNSGGVRHETIDLSAYSGTVLLAFRYVTDSGVDNPGWWVDNVTVDATVLSDGTTTSGWQSATQVRPVPVAGYTVQLVGYTDDGSAAWYYNLPLTHSGNQFTGSLSGTDLAAALGTSAQTVAAIVMQDDPTESAAKYARYTLTVNGVVQPGG